MEQNVFLQPQLLHNIGSIIQYYYYFFPKNSTIIYWMKEKTKSCFLRVASRAPVRIQQNLYIYSIWMDMTKKPTEFHFCPDECFVRKWRLKFQVSKCRLRWNTENMTSSIMCPQNKLHNFYEHFISLRALY